MGLFTYSARVIEESYIMLKFRYVILLESGRAQEQEQEQEQRETITGMMHSTRRTDDSGDLSLNNITAATISCDERRTATRSDKV